MYTNVYVFIHLFYTSIAILRIYVGVQEAILKHRMSVSGTNILNVSKVLKYI